MEAEGRTYLIGVEGLPLLLLCRPTLSITLAVTVPGVTPTPWWAIPCRGNRDDESRCFPLLARSGERDGFFFGCVMAPEWHREQAVHRFASQLQPDARYARS